MLTYHIVRRKHFKTGKLLFYPQLVTPVADDHMHIIERIEKKCTLASADVKAVVDALEVEIIDSLDRDAACDSATWALSVPPSAARRAWTCPNWRAWGRSSGCTWCSTPRRAFAAPSP